MSQDRSGDQPCEARIESDSVIGSRKSPNDGTSPEELVVGFYSLSRERDETHNIPITNDVGMTFFRESQPGLDYRQCELDLTNVAMFKSGEFIVWLSVRPEFQADLDLWSREHIDHLIGFVEGDRLVHAEVVKTHFMSHVGIMGFQSESRARDLCDGLRRLSSEQ